MNMMEHTAKSIGDQFYQKLSGSALRGEVHSVFQNVINVLLNGNLFTIGKAKIGNGPCTVLLSNTVENLDTWGVQPGDPVMVNQRFLKLHTARIDLTEAVVWKSEWKGTPHLERMVDLLPQLAGLVVREGNLRGLGFLLLSEEQQKEEQIIEYTQLVLIEQAEPLIDDLKKSMSLHFRHFWPSLLELVGLGPGLTPAGDDFIVGFLLTLRYLEWAGFVRLPELELSSVSEQVKRDTNLISASGVILALEGKPFELVRDVIENLCEGSKVKTTLSALRLMDRGSTSGTDIITGILVAGDLFYRSHRND